jgi:2'-5' RNA ligase
VPTAAASARLFLALWPDPEVRAALRESRDSWTWNPSAAPVPDENLHLTLHFLGDVPRSRLTELGAGLRVAFEAFDLSLTRFSTWPHGVAVLEPDSIPTGLLMLHAELGDALRRLDLPVESKPYRPHVTLARHAGGAVAPADRPQIPWTAGVYALVESPRGRAGIYSVVRSYRSSER